MSPAPSESDMLLLLALLIVGVIIGLAFLASAKRTGNILLFVGAILLTGFFAWAGSYFLVRDNHASRVNVFFLLGSVGIIILVVRMIRSTARREFRAGPNRIGPPPDRFQDWQANRRSSSDMGFIGLALIIFVGLALLILIVAFVGRQGGGDVTVFALVAMAALIGWTILRFFRNHRGTARLAACPPLANLQDLAADRLPSAVKAQVAGHLEACPMCLRRFEELTAGRKSWPDLAEKLAARPPAEPALRRAMDDLKSHKDPEVTRDQPLFHADLPLGFLSPPDKPDQLGKLGTYEVLSEIGRGGMGIVLKAFDPTLHRVVAIKVLAPQLATSGVARKRFMREAQAVAAVTHDHIVTIHAVDEANGLPYLVMQCVAGMSLQDRIDKEGPLPLKEIVRIGMQTASGLAAAHAQGIVHRDIKPGNILLENGVQRVKITDFGLARAMDDASLTGSGYVAGSPQFMAPEQARGETLDHRADLFSLGSVLYTMCTGRPPFRAANTLAILRRVCDDTPRLVREINPEIPEWLAEVVDKLHAKNPAARYSSASEVADVLGQYLAQLQGAPWVPQPKPTGIQEPGLLTSLTVCPSCGAHLHVPEKMVGSVVHCSDCGKPFQVEDGSEIQVARAVRPPMPVRRRSRNRTPGWIVLFILGLMAVAAMAFLWMGASRYEMQPAHAEVDVPGETHNPGPYFTSAERTTVAESRPMATQQPFWRNTLSWLPEEATLFGAVNLQPFGALTLNSDMVQAAMRLLIPSETRKQLTRETMGPVRIDSVSAAYYAEATNPAKSRQYLHVVGLPSDGHRRLAECFAQAMAGGKIEEVTPSADLSRRLRVSGSSAPVAVGLYDDNHVFIAGSADEVKGPPALKVLERITGFNSSPVPNNLLTGYNPPWVKITLQQFPSGIDGMLIGEIPHNLRQWLTRDLGFSVCPRRFFLTFYRARQGVSSTLGQPYSVAYTLGLSSDKQDGETEFMDQLITQLRKNGSQANPSETALRLKAAQLLMKILTSAGVERHQYFDFVVRGELTDTELRDWGRLLSDLAKEKEQGRK